MGKTKTWEDEYTNMLKLKKSKQNFNDDKASFCNEKCRFQIDSSSPEKNLKIELSKEGSKNVDSVMNINISGNGNGHHKLIYNGGIENSSEYVEYTLTNMFVKLVSLHAINSDKYKMELVMQYVSSDDDVVYVCILLNPVDNNQIDEEGDVYEFFNEMANVFPSKVGKEVNVTKIKNWRISTLLPPKDDSGYRSFYTYNSAKTVNWIIFKTPLNIPVNFYDTFIDELGVKEKNISDAMNIIPKTRKNITYVSDYDDSVMIKGFDGTDDVSGGGSSNGKKGKKKGGKKGSSKKGSGKKGSSKKGDIDDDDDDDEDGDDKNKNNSDGITLSPVFKNPLLYVVSILSLIIIVSLGTMYDIKYYVIAGISLLLFGILYVMFFKMNDRKDIQVFYCIVLSIALFVVYRKPGVIDNMFQNYYNYNNNNKSSSNNSYLSVNKMTKQQLQRNGVTNVL